MIVRRRLPHMITGMAIIPLMILPGLSGCHKLGMGDPRTMPENAQTIMGPKRPPARNLEKQQMKTMQSGGQQSANTPSSQGSPGNYWSAETGWSTQNPSSGSTHSMPPASHSITAAAPPPPAFNPVANSGASPFGQPPQRSGMPFASNDRPVHSNDRIENYPPQSQPYPPAYQPPAMMPPQAMPAAMPPSMPQQPAYAMAHPMTPPPTQMAPAPGFAPQTAMAGGGFPPISPYQQMPPAPQDFYGAPPAPPPSQHAAYAPAAPAPYADSGDDSFPLINIAPPLSELPTPLPKAKPQSLIAAQKRADLSDNHQETQPEAFPASQQQAAAIAAVKHRNLPAAQPNLSTQQVQAEMPVMPETSAAMPAPAPAPAMTAAALPPSPPPAVTVPAIPEAAANPPVENESPAYYAPTLATASHPPALPESPEGEEEYPAVAPVQAAPAMAWAGDGYEDSAPASLPPLHPQAIATNMAEPPITLTPPSLTAAADLRSPAMIQPLDYSELTPAAGTDAGDEAITLKPTSSYDNLQPPNRYSGRRRTGSY